MNWYKKAQEFRDIEAQEFRDIEESFQSLDYIDQERKKMLDEYYDKKRKKGQMMSWDVIPLRLIKPIWEDYSRLGIVRNTRGMDEIVNKILKNLHRIQAATELAGHSQFDTEEWANEMGLKHPASKNTDFYFDFLETQYGTPISDFAMDKLWKLARQLYRATSYEEKILFVDQILQVAHQRNDLSALFIEGGQASLDQLFEA